MEKDPGLEWKKNGMEYLDGPDQILPSSTRWTCHSEGAIQMRLESQGAASRKPISVPSLLEKMAAESPNHTALSVKRDGIWVKWTYSQYLREVRTCAKALIHLGLQRHHAVAIIGSNAPEWFFSDVAAIFAGGVAMGIYTTNSPEACFYCLEDSQANIAIVEDADQLQKILPFKSKLPHLKTIIQYSGKPQQEGILNWSQMMYLGTQQPDDILEDRIKKIAINQCCAIVYTSGTTGPPKGAMLSHDNLTWTGHAVADRMEMTIPNQTYVSYLPLSHVAAQLTDIYCMMSAKSTVYFGDKDALKGTLVSTLKEARPMWLLGVPRVWEKIVEKMQEAGKKTRGLKKLLVEWAKGRGWEHVTRQMKGNPNLPFAYSLANSLVFKKVRRALGFDRLAACASGAAPVSWEVLEFFARLDIPILETFGMSECCGPHCLSKAQDFRLGSVGKPMPGCQLKIHQPDDKGNGEVCLWGRNTFMGYLSMPEKTAEAIDADGWLHSGDIGKIDDCGYLYITGRIKELLITAGGENIPPVLVENQVKSQLPCVHHVVVLGDRKKFVSALLTLRTETDLGNGEPLDQLDSVALSWCREIGSEATTVSQILKERDEKVFKGIQDGIDRANKNAAANPQCIRKWAILPKDLSIPGGELGPTMKVKRNEVLSKYEHIVVGFYSENE